MQKKGLKYILIALVVLIWGMIVYRIIHGTGPGESTLPPPPRQESARPSERPDTFTLIAQYPDPFLDQPDAVPDEPLEKGEVPRSAPVVPAQPGNGSPLPPAFNPAEVQYIGFIGNASTKRRTAMVTYKGTEYMVKETDKIGDIKVLKIASGSMVISYKGVSYTLVLQR